MLSIGLGELLVLFGVCALGLIPLALAFMLFRGSLLQTKTGLNLDPPKVCPVCGEALPQLRAPANFRQAMWGGWTCGRCRSELDKWGRVLRRGDVQQ